MPEQVVYTLPESPAPALPAAAEGEYVHNEAMVAEAQALLIEFFRKPRWLDAVAAFATEVQEVEDAFWGTHTSFDVDTAVGDQLDILGRLVGELRDDRVDDDYRAAVRTRILVNSSDGKLEQLIAIVQSLLPAATVQAAEYYPASLSFAVSTLGSVTFNTVYGLLHKAKAAGVRLEFTHGAGTIGAEDDNPLGGTIGAEDDNPLGFSISAGT